MAYLSLYAVLVLLSFGQVLCHTYFDESKLRFKVRRVSLPPVDVGSPISGAILIVWSTFPPAAATTPL